MLGALATGKKPDAIAHDPHTHRVFVANGESGSLSVTDADKSKVIATVDIGGKLEFEAVDGKGRLYVNIENRNALAVVDTISLAAITRYDLSASCNEPTGLAIDPAAERLFVGCRNQKSALVSGRTSEILATVPIRKGCDATAFDSGLKLAFGLNGEGRLTIISADTYTVRQTLVTHPTARTMGLHEARHRVYTVAADADVPSEPRARHPTKSGHVHAVDGGAIVSTNFPESCYACPAKTGVQ